MSSQEVNTTSVEGTFQGLFKHTANVNVLVYGFENIQERPLRLFDGHEAEHRLMYRLANPLVIWKILNEITLVPTTFKKQ